MSDGTPKIATLVVDLEARGMAQEAKSAGLLSQQAISDHMRTCERDKKLTTDALRDLAQGIKDVDAAGRERAVRQHERMDMQGAMLSEIKTELAAMPKQIADAVAEFEAHISHQQGCVERMVKPGNIVFHRLAH